MRTAFAALRGAAGALLGACLSAEVFRALARVLCVSPLDLLPLLWGCLTLCPAAYGGYWCFRGLRNWKAGYGTAWVCSVLALPLVLGQGSWADRLAAGVFFTGLSGWIGREAFLRWLDPARYRDPRRIAAWHGRGWLSGHWHISPPFGREVPAAFDVQAVDGVFHVQGDAVRVEPRLRRGWTFSLQEVAGVIQAPGVGRCVPYNAQGQALAVFCLTQPNGELFAQCLRNRGVPFYRLNEVPAKGPLPMEAGDGARPRAASPLGEALWEAVSEYAAELEQKEQEEPVRHTDFSRILAKDHKDFQLTLRRTIPFGALIGGGLLLGLVTFFAGFPIIAIHNGPHVDLELRLMLAAVFVFEGGPWVYALAKGELFPPRLSVENGRLWLDKGLFPIREIPLEALDSLHFDPSDDCYILYGRQGRPLLKFSTRDDGGPQLMNLLTDHDIRIRA